MNKYEQAIKIMENRFAKDSIISLATMKEGKPHVRAVDGYYEDGAFYVVTYELSNKMKQIMDNPLVAVCGEWFSGHGIGKNLGWVMEDENAPIMSKLRQEFGVWYDNGHVDEEDENTCLLKIELTSGEVIDHERTQGHIWYDVDFEQKIAK